MSAEASFTPDSRADASMLLTPLGYLASRRCRQAGLAISTLSRSLSMSRKRATGVLCGARPF